MRFEGKSRVSCYVRILLSISVMTSLNSGMLPHALGCYTLHANATQLQNGIIIYEPHRKKSDMSTKATVTEKSHDSFCVTVKILRLGSIRLWFTARRIIFSWLSFAFVEYMIDRSYMSLMGDYSRRCGLSRRLLEISKKVSETYYWHERRPKDVVECPPTQISTRLILETRHVHALAAQSPLCQSATLQDKRLSTTGSHGEASRGNEACHRVEKDRHNVGRTVDHVR